MIDYRSWRLSGKEWGILIIQYSLWVMFHAYLFFHSLIGILFLLPLLIPKIKAYRDRCRRKRKQQMLREWKEALRFIQVSLEAGYSLENSFAAARTELERLVNGNPSVLLDELYLLERKLAMSARIEDALEDLAQRSGIEEIEDLAQVISLGKRSGGNLIHIIRKMNVSLTNKWEVEEEIQTMISGKKMEQKIMSYMPVGILLYMRITNGAYIRSLYENAVGTIVCLAGIAVMQWAEYYAAKIIRIEV